MSEGLLTAVFLGMIAAGGFWQYERYSRSFSVVPVHSHHFQFQEDMDSFNLNTIPFQELAAMPGMTRAYAKAILHHRKENGYFSSTAELLEVEGLPEEIAVFLIEHAYVLELPTSVPTEKPIKEEQTETTECTKPTEALETQTEIVFPLNLNTAAFEELCALPGIGESLASAILAYRDRIGGFTCREQLLEIPGIGDAKLKAIHHLLYLPDEILPETQPIQPPETMPVQVQPTDPPEIPIIDLNTATAEELMRLPGCTPELTDAILYLRDEQIHVFSNPLELLYAEGMTDALYIQWMPYLTVIPPATE